MLSVSSASTSPRSGHGLDRRISVGTRWRHEAKFPMRHRAFATEPVSDSDKRVLGRHGVLRDRWGRPIYDASEDMLPIKARGLGVDHGVYHEMLRSDGAIAGVSSLTRRETKRAYYDIWTPPKPTKLEEDVAAFMRRLTGLDGTSGWIVGGLKRALGHASKAFDYGFSACELTWDRRMWRGAPVWVPTRIDWRAPWSVDGWVWQNGELVGMTQRVQETRSFEFASPFVQRQVIPANKLLLFTHDYVDGNPEGTAVPRPAWIYWRWKKDTIVRHEMAEERLFGGVMLLKELGDPTRGPTKSIGEKDERDFESAFELMVENLLAWLKVPYGYEVEANHPEFQIPSPVDTLMYCDRQIFLALAAVLLGLDASHAGSKSLSDGLGALLYKSLAASVDELLEIFNGLEGVPYSGLMRKAVRANFDLPDDFRWPRLISVGLEHQDAKAFADLLYKAGTSGLLSFTPMDQAMFRKVTGLPTLPEDLLEQLMAAMRPTPIQLPNIGGDPETTGEGSTMIGGE